MKTSFLRMAGRGIALFFIYALITAIFFRPVLQHLSVALIGTPEDNYNDFWNLWYATNAADYRNFFHTDLLRYPQGTSLLYQDFTFPHTVLIFLITRLTGASHATLTVLQNLSVLLSFPLAGLGGYYLARHFSLSTAAAILAGFIFAFNPSHTAHAFHHMGLAQIEYFPFFALCWIRTIDQKSYRWLAASVLLYLLAALSSWYYLFFIAFFVIFHTIYLRIRDDALPTGWRLAAPLICFASTAILLLPLILPMIRIHSGGGGPSVGGSNMFVADLLGFVTFPPDHILGELTKPLFAQFTGNAWEATVYLGIVNLGLYIFFFRRTDQEHHRLRNYLTSGLIVFSVLAMGDSLHISGTDLSYIHLPNIVLGYVPFLNIMRTPSRYIVFSYMFLAVGVGYAITELCNRAAKPWQMAIIATLCAMIVLDFWPTGIPLTSTACPAILENIKHDPDAHFGVVDLPLTYENADAAMFRQTCHGKPIVVAILSRTTQPALMDKLLESDGIPPHGALKSSDVKYIIWNKQISAKQPLESYYKKIIEDKDIAIYRVY